MVRNILLTCAALTLCTAPLAAQDISVSSATSSEASDERLTLAKAIIDMSFPKDTQVEMFQKVTDQMEAQMLQSLRTTIADEAALALIKQWQERISIQTDEVLRRHIPSLMDAWAVAYADTYSEGELADILEFVSTPSGQAFMIRSQDLISHPTFANANQELLNESMALVMSKVPDLMKELAVYKDEQAAVAD